ncbi:hypothetical protein KV100_03105 [Mumia sp. zg.B21]|uniref:helicase-related protein n=1 Tax=Mumia sp. zg.B21 TaxID=2855447 RepID=UPI001C6E4B9E|nr:helicase-related protein [Mumia sp. zg.B21]MBW9208629.1 hypothetical protein [Mumia sp. zg.B21]
MTDPVERPDLEAELAVLKDFQRRTVDRVHKQFWHPTDPTRRFLVADEVGLGKTMVARGVIAKTIDHLWETVPRIDVVYICSNAQIARQNLPKLRVGEGVAERHHADRLTLLASELHHLEGRKLNFVSFTPGTSFNISRTGGRVEERVLLYWLLRKAWGGDLVRPGPWTRFFRGRVEKARFERKLREFDPAVLSADLVRDFAGSVATITNQTIEALEASVLACVEEYRVLGSRPAPDGLSARRYRLVGELRRALARAAVKRLEPDLVILDEFQRFKDLMADEGEGAELARELFDHGDARLLLLSATPFKMYTLPEEPEGDDHYCDFVDTVRFLAGGQRADSVKRDLASLRTSLYADDRASARQARDRAQTELRRIMSRTERLATTADRDGLVVEREWSAVELKPADVRDFRRLHQVSRVLSAQDPLEFWRAAPYVLELMESYQVKQKLQRHQPDDLSLLDALNVDGNARLRWDDIQQYVAVDPGNAKMRGLAADVLESGAWRLAWLPPSLPYYDLGGPFADPGLEGFTKRLVFSSWAVAPKAIGTVISYEAERRIADRASRVSSSAGFTRYDGTRPTGRLTFNVTDGRLGGMPVLGMLYPCVSLAAAGDPLDVARELGVQLPIPRQDLERVIRGRVARLLDTLPPGPADGVVDESWYWAAGVLLDRARDVDAIDTLPYGFSYEEDDDPTRFDEHTKAASRVQAESLGKRPADLIEVLSALSLGGAGVSALRALTRLAPSADIASRDIRAAASNIAWSLRNLFNKPEIMGVVLDPGASRPYWQDVLSYSVDGGLQSVLDEYVYLLEQAVGGKNSAETWHGVAERFDEAASLRTATHSFHDIAVENGLVAINGHRTRTHFAVRFGRGVAEDDKSVMREGQVRAAFNSPFWPFVLASTSVGQEGLDFHHYSHAIVHWNLPANPVDLEQREGRVHRYQGHAIRRNVAAGYGARPEVVAAGNVWTRMFDLATADRPAGMNDLYPSWVPPLMGTARIERYVPALPLSRETHALRRLLRTVGAYRLVLGQPRQSDLLRYLGDRAADLGDLCIDLEP